MVTFRTAWLALLVVALLVAAVVVALRLRYENPRHRSVVRVRHVLGPAVLVAALIGLGLTPLGVTTFEIVYTVGEVPGPDADTAPVGESVTRTVEVPVAALPGTTYVIRGQGVTVETWEREARTLVVTVALPAADEPGIYQATLRLTPYPATLPRSTLASLHDRSPLASMAGATGAALVPFYLLARGLLDGDRPVLRTRHRWVRRRLGE